MKIRMLLPLLFLFSCISSRIEASHFCSLEADITFFSIHLVFLEKNSLRIERYELYELNEGDNYICRKTSNAHCTHMLSLGERGMHICKLDCNVDCPGVLNIEASRGTKTMHQQLNWAALLLNDASQVQSAMHARTNMITLDEVFAQTDHANQGNWRSSVSISWGVRKKRVMNLIFERSMDCVHAFVIPNVLCKECDNEIKVMKRIELISAGILKNLDEQEDLKDKQNALSRAPKGSCCTQSVSEQNTCAQGQCQSMISSLLHSLIAKIVALKDSLVSLCSK